MLKTFNLAFGGVFLVLGVCGLNAATHHQDLLFGSFRLNFAHHVLHLITAAVALVTGLISEHSAKMFFRILGIAYGMLGAIGYACENRPVFEILAGNAADAWLYAAFAVAALLLGFVVRDSSLPGMERQMS